MNSKIKKTEKELICQTCKKKEGQQRIDNGLNSGVHCDECWEKMIIECKQRSW